MAAAVDHDQFPRFAGTREAFTAPLTPEPQSAGNAAATGNECTAREQASNHDASRLAAAVILHIAGLEPSTFTDSAVLTA